MSFFDNSLKKKIKDLVEKKFQALSGFDPEIVIGNTQGGWASVVFKIPSSKLSYFGATVLLDKFRNIVQDIDNLFVLSNASAFSSDGKFLFSLEWDTADEAFSKYENKIDHYVFSTYVDVGKLNSTKRGADMKISKAAEIAIDLDGTLIEDRFPFLGKPIEANVELVRKLHDAGYRIVIFTARLTTRPGDKAKIEKFLRDRDIPFDKITNIKPSTASVFIDDRSINVKYNENWPRNIIDRIEKIIKDHKDAKAKLKKASLEHPDTIVFKPNEYYTQGLTEQQVFDYYNKYANQIVEQLKDKPVMIVIRTPAGDIIRKNDPADGTLTISNIEDFNNKLNTGRTIEVHRILKDEEKFGIVDVDPRPEVPFEDTKKLTQELVDFLKEAFSDILDNIQVYFSGNRGFHIYLNWKKEMNVTEMRQELRKALENFLIQKKDPKVKLELPTRNDETRLDITIYHPGGSIRVPYSLHKKTGLAAIPVNNIMEFDPKSAIVVKSKGSYINPKFFKK